MKHETSLSEQEVCEAVTYWLNNCTEIANSHTFDVQEVSIKMLPGGVINAVAHWEETVDN